MHLLLRRKTSRLILFVGGLLLMCLVVYLIATKIVNSIDYQNSDFFSFWLAGRLVIQGGNPYSPDQWVPGHQIYGATWISDQTYLYPLPLSLLFAPLGMLPLFQGYIVWVALSIIMILASLFLLMVNKPNFSHIAVPLLVGLTFFRPTILTLFQGQISAMLLLCLAGILYLWGKGHWQWGSSFLPLLLLKPNLGGPLLLLLSTWQLFRRRYRSILAISFGGMILVGIGFLQNPHWLSAYWGIGSLKVAQNFGGSPTVWGLGYLVCRSHSPCMPIFGGIASFLLIFTFGWLILRKHDITPLHLVSLAICVTLLITPYTWTYDQLLLVIPVTALMLSLNLAGKRFLLTASLFLAIDILVVILLYFDTLMHIEIFNALIPLLILALCGWSFSRDHTARAENMPPGTRVA
jgi:hypothetical protein